MKETSAAKAAARFSPSAGIAALIRRFSAAARKYRVEWWILVAGLVIVAAIAFVPLFLMFASLRGKPDVQLTVAATRAQLRKLQVKDLKALANAYGLPTSGTKGTLVWRQEEPESITIMLPGQPDRVYWRGAVAPGDGFLPKDVPADLMAEPTIPAGHPEAFHDAFARLVEKGIAFPSMDDAKFWLIRVVKNGALNYAKRKGREAKAYERWWHGEKESAGGADEVVLKNESAEELKAGLEALPENLKAVLILKEYGGLSYKEIGRALGISEGNVKVRAFRAREALQVKLGEGTKHVS